MWIYSYSLFLGAEKAVACKQQVKNVAEACTDADREWIGADTLDEVFSLSVLLQQLVGVYRWLQLLQFFKEPKILIPDLLYSVRHKS